MIYVSKKALIYLSFNIFNFDINKTTKIFVKFVLILNKYRNVKNKCKIYIFHPYSNIGGADLSISRIIRNLDFKDFDVDFICLNEQKIHEYLKIKKINIIKIKANRSFFSISKVRKYLIRDKKKNYKKYIFVSNQNFANVISFFILNRLKWIKHILIERNHLDEFKFNKSLKNFLIQYLMKYLYKKSDLIIGISKKLSTDLKDFVNKKVLTIYNPAFDKNIYKLSKSKIKIKKSKNIILSVGRFEKQKDPITILKAFKIVSKKIDTKLIMIGYGSEYEKLNKFIKINNLNNKVKILTNVKNPFPYFKLAKVFVLSSKYEGFGNVLVEAAMFKLKIVSSNCNSGPKEILLNGKGGELFKVGNYKDLSKKIMNSLKFNNKKKVDRLYNSLDRFNINLISKKYINLFKSI
mgnify:CR=1 FL=1